MIIHDLSVLTSWYYVQFDFGTFQSARREDKAPWEHGLWTTGIRGGGGEGALQNISTR